MIEVKPAESNFCILHADDIDKKINEWDMSDYSLGGIVTMMHISDFILSEGISWGKNITFKLKSSLN